MVVSIFLICIRIIWEQFEKPQHETFGPNRIYQAFVFLLQKQVDIKMFKIMVASLILTLSPTTLHSRLAFIVDDYGWKPSIRGGLEEKRQNHF